MRIPMAALAAYRGPWTLKPPAAAPRHVVDRRRGASPETASYRAFVGSVLRLGSTPTRAATSGQGGVLLERFPFSGKLVDEFNKANQADGVTFGQGQGHARPRHGIAGARPRTSSSVVLFTKSPKPDDLQALPEEGQPARGQQGGRRLGGRRRDMAARRPVHGCELDGSLADDRRLQGRGGQGGHRRARARLRARQDDPRPRSRRA